MGAGTGGWARAGEERIRARVRVRGGAALPPGRWWEEGGGDWEEGRDKRAEAQGRQGGELATAGKGQRERENTDPGRAEKGAATPALQF